MTPNPFQRFYQGMRQSWLIKWDWQQVEPSNGEDPCEDTEEIAAMEEAYQEWHQFLEAAIASGDPQRIAEAWELGQ